MYTYINAKSTICNKSINCVKFPSIYFYISHYERIFFTINICSQTSFKRNLRVIYCVIALIKDFFCQDFLLFLKEKFKGNTKFQEVEGLHLSNVATVQILLSQRSDVLLYFLRPFSSTHYYLPLG